MVIRLPGLVEWTLAYSAIVVKRTPMAYAILRLVTSNLFKPFVRSSKPASGSKLYYLRDVDGVHVPALGLSCDLQLSQVSSGQTGEGCT